jgi:hypothetical protein
MLGHARENVLTLRTAAEYLEKHNAGLAVWPEYKRPVKQETVKPIKEEPKFENRQQVLDHIHGLNPTTELGERVARMIHCPTKLDKEFFDETTREYLRGLRQRYDGTGRAAA